MKPAYYSLQKSHHERRRNLGCELPGNVNSSEHDGKIQLIYHHKHTSPTVLFVEDQGGGVVSVVIFLAE